MVSPAIGKQVTNFSPRREKFSVKVAFQKIYKIVSFRYMPHIIKKYFWYSHADFWEIRGDKSSLFFNYDMYDLIRNQGVIAEETDHNIYQFYWIQGPHEPVNTDKYCQKTDQTIGMGEETYAGSQFEQTIGVVRMYTELISALKEAGIYDNTTVIFTADHGWDIRPNPCLLVKPTNAHGELEVSDVPVSMIEDYLPTLEYFITGEKDFGDTIYELRSGMNRERIYYEYAFNVTDFDRTYDSRIERVCNAGTFSKDVKLGKKLLPDNIWVHKRLGFSESEHTHIWTEGSEAVLEFEIEEEFNDLRLDLNYGTYNGIQPVKLYVNNILVEEFEANGQEDKSILIPGEYVKDGNLKLQFRFTNEISPAEIDPNNGDRRKLALALNSLVLSDTSMQYEVGNYVLGTELTFNKANNSAKDNCLTGFSEAEETFTWTNSHTAHMGFYIPNKDLKDMVLEYTCASFNGKQHVILYANDKKIAEYDHNGEETKEVTIPAECIGDGELNLRFELPDAKSPKELGMSEDDRTLGLAMEKLVIDVAD